MLGPDPRIIFILLGHSGIPWTAQHVMKLLLQVAIRPHISIELFLLPNKSAFTLELVNFMCRKRLIECIKSLTGQKKMLPLLSLLFGHGWNSRCTWSDITQAANRS